MRRFLYQIKETKQTLKKYALPLIGFKVVKLIAVFLFVYSGLHAQDNSELFEKANELYRNEKYVKAIGMYEEIEASGLVSSELYYNLGSAYYKINKVAPSIYNLEKALLLNPQNTEAANNLVFANRMKIDAIEELPKTFFQNLEIDVIQQLSYNQWAYFAVFSSILMSLFFLFFYFSYIPARKRVYFVTSLLGVFFLIVSLSFTYKQYVTSIATVAAIVYDGKVSVKNAPSDTSQEIFELHEGLKVFVLDEVDVWQKIKLADGKTGWIHKESLKIL
tara:strand:- start:4182 stop:5009 length:828 start_codon:yes stop_codon:yes gene_type:complete